MYERKWFLLKEKRIGIGGDLPNIIYETRFPWSDINKKKNTENGSTMNFKLFLTNNNENIYRNELGWH